MSRNLSAYKTCSTGAPRTRERTKFLWLPAKDQSGRLHWLKRVAVSEEIVIVTSWAPGMSHRCPVAKWLVTSIRA
jgi:hypothetical protein